MSAPVGGRIMNDTKDELLSLWQYIGEPHLEQLVSTCQKLAWENLLVLLSLRVYGEIENALVG
jgi:hypothetical protein